LKNKERGGKNEKESSDSSFNDDFSSELFDEGNLFEELPTSISLKDGEIHLSNYMISF